MRRAPHADFLVINVSSPNTPGLRELQRATRRNTIAPAARGARRQRARPPLLVKIAPDLTEEDRADIAAVALERASTV